MKNINRLKEERWAILQEAKSILDNAQKENRKLTTEEREKHQKMMADVQEMGENITEREKLAYEEARNMKVQGGSQPEKAAGTKRGPDFRSLFGDNHDNGGYENLGEFLRAIGSGQYDPKLQKRFQTLDPGAAGGFTAPIEYGGMLLDAGLESEIVRPRANVRAMNSNLQTVAAWDGLDQSAGDLYGGFQSVWMDEAELANIQDAAVRQITLNARKLALFTAVSNELLADGQEFEQQLTRAMGSALSYNLDQAFLFGAGGGQPQGVLNAATNDALIQVNRAVGNQVAYADLVNMYSRLHSAAQDGAVWVANHTVLPELMTMIDANGNLIWSPDSRAGVPNTLFGKPVIWSSKVGQLGAASDISLVNFKHYIVGLRKEIQIAKSNDVGFQRDVAHFRCIVRVDGASAWDKVFTDANGNTMSYAVTLDA